MKRFFQYTGLIILFSTLACQRSTDQRKIKLASQQTTRTDDQLTTTIHLEPTMRRAIAVMFFENETRDENLEWLQKGLTEMFIRSLSQSQNLNVLGSDRMHEIMERLEEKGDKTVDMDMAAIVAQEANVEALLTGNITKEGDSIKIHVRVHEPQQGQILKEESIEGPGLETIFSMVDDLTKKIKEDLNLRLDVDSGQSITDLSTNSLEAWRLYTSGREFDDQVLYPQAINQFTQAIELDSSFVAAYLQLCPLVFNQGEIEKGLELTQRLYALRYKATPQEKYQIDLLRSNINQDIVGSIEITKEWLEKYPDDRDANLTLAHFNYGTQNYNEAIEYYKRVLEIDPKYKMSYNQIGYIHANRGDFLDAITYLEKYKEIAPDEPNPYDSMGEVLRYQGDFKKAEKQFKQALKINRTFLASKMNLAQILIDQGKFKKAEKILHEYLKESPDKATRTTAMGRLGIIQWRRGNLKEAHDYFLKALETTINPFQYTEWILDLYAEQNDSISGIQLMDTLYEKTKSTLELNPTTFTMLGSWSIWYGVRVQETIEILEGMISDTDLSVQQMQVRLMLSLLYMQTGRYDDANRVSNQAADTMVQYFGDLRTIPYVDGWRYYGLANQLIQPYDEYTLNEYKNLIEICQKRNLIMPEMLFRSFSVDIYKRLGKITEMQEMLQIVGSPRESQWMLIGPFDNKNGFNRQFEPEKKIDLKSEYQGKDQSITWQHATDPIEDNYIDLRYQIKNPNWSVTYGYIYLYAPSARDVQFRLGSNEAVKVWLNDQEVWRFNNNRDAIFDDDITNVHLKAGFNKILIKVCNRNAQYGYFFRVTEENGRGMSDVYFVAADAL